MFGLAIHAGLQSTTIPLPVALAVTLERSVSETSTLSTVREVPLTETLTDNSTGSYLAIRAWSEV